MGPTVNGCYSINPKIAPKSFYIPKTLQRFATFSRYKNIGGEKEKNEKTNCSSNGSDIVVVCFDGADSYVRG